MRTLKQIVDGVSLYAINDAIPSMPNGLAKFLAYGAVGAMRNKDVSQLVAPYSSMLTAVGIMDADGNVDEAALRDALTEAFSNVPSVSVAGFTFTADDKDKLLRRLGL